MKSIQILIASIVFSFLSSAQDYKDVGTYPESKHLGFSHDIHISPNKVILNFSKYLVPLDLKFSLYKSAPLNVPGSLEDEKIKPEDGIIRDCFFSGDTITEYVIYYDQGFSNYSCTFAIRNRSIKTMQLLGNEKKLAKHSFYNGFPMEYRRVRLIQRSNGYAFVKFIEDSISVMMLDNNFEETNKVVVSGSEVVDVSCKYCYNIRPNVDGSITFCFSDKTGVKLLQVNDNGESKWMTKLNFEQKVNASSLIDNFSFNSQNKENSWCYLAKSESSDQNGYGIVKWNEDGDIITNNVVMLSDEEIYLNDKDLKSFFEVRKKTTRDIFEQSTTLNPGVYQKSIGKDDYLIISLFGAYRSFSICYVLKLNNSGGFDWIKPIVTEIGQDFSILPYEKNGKLNLFLTDYTANSKNDFHQVNSSKKSDKAFSFYNIILDPVNGEEVGNTKYNADTGSEVVIKNVQFSSNGEDVVIEFIQGDQVVFRQIKL